MTTRFSLAALLAALLTLAPASFAQSFSTQGDAPGITRSIGDVDVQRGGTVLTHSTSQTITQFNSVSCNNGFSLHTDNSYFRFFDLNAFGITGDFAVSDVTIGVESAGAGSGGVQPIELRLHTLSGSPSLANLTPLGTVATTVPDGDLVPFTFTVPGTVVPAGSVLGVEIFTPNGQTAGNSFFIGSNADAETGLSYLATSGECGISDITSVDDIGQPNMHIVMNVTGVESASGPSIDIAVNTFTNTPMRGESVFFRGPVTNTGAATEFVYVYAEVDVPGFPNPFKRNIGGKDLAPGETFAYKDFPKSKNFFPLPFEAPDGTYTITVYAADDRFGTTIYDQDSFSFDLSSVCTASAGGCLTASLPTVASLETAAPTAAPNPFQGATEIRYALAEDAEVDLRVYDVTGREVAVLASGSQSAGSHAAVFTAGDLPGGVYVWRLAIGAEVTTGRVTLSR